MPKSVCVLLLGTALLSCSDQKEIQITGTVRNLNGGMIVYQQSIAGMMNTKTIDTLQIQSDSTFTLTLPVEDYERVNFILYGKAVLGSVISKGGKIQLDVDATAQKPLTIRGVDEKAVAVSRLLNRLNAAVWDLRARRGDRWQIAKDTVATSVAQKLKDDAVSLESQLTGLDEDLQEKARQDIRMQLLLAFQNQTMGAFYQASEATRQNWFTELDQMTAFCIPDSLAITVQKNRFTAAQVLGVAVMSRGKLYNFCMLTVKRNQPFSFRLDKKNLPVGVSQLVLFDKAGQVLADRLVFVGKPDTLSLAVRTDKEQYLPYDSIDISFEVNDPQGQPAPTLLSVSVRDGREEVESRHSMLTDLLLMSEIKGYVRRPSWYFESDDTLHRRALDELLMVQGWRRYEWKHWAGVEPFELKYLPEQGIELHGQVVSMVRSKPRPDVQVTSFLTKRGEEDNPTDQNTSCFDVFTTDSSGRFSFISQVEGKWNLILSVSEKGKKKDHRIVLDRVFHPEPRRYPMAELQVHISGDEKVSLPDTQLNDTVFMQENMEQLFKAYEDSLRKLGMDEKIHRIDEVVVKAKKLDKAAEVYKTRTKSIAYYDVASEMDDIQDRNGFIGDDIHELMINMNSEFYREHSPGGQEYLFYKGRMVLFAINYERTYHNEMDYNKYRLLPLEAIKSVYISEDFGTICRYADPRFTPINIDKLYRCVVLIETYPEDQISVKGGKGVRKTWLEGYSEVKDFYQPDYRVLPKENDYRRTLYWNPALSTDEQGKAYIRFYNNSRCKYPRITVETLTEDGKIGVFRQ